MSSTHASIVVTRAMGDCSAGREVLLACQIDPTTNVIRLSLPQRRTIEIHCAASMRRAFPEVFPNVMGPWDLTWVRHPRFSASWVVAVDLDDENSTGDPVAQYNKEFSTFNDDFKLKQNPWTRLPPLCAVLSALLVSRFGTSPLSDFAAFTFFFMHALYLFKWWSSESTEDMLDRVYHDSPSPLDVRWIWAPVSRELGDLQMFDPVLFDFMMYNFDLFGFPEE